MTTGPTEENPANLSVSDREDRILTKDTIEGLGATRLRYLKEWFKIRTVQDLAALSVDRIEARFEAEGKRVPRRDEIESWIAQAQAFVPVASLSSQKAVEPTESETEGRANHPTLEAGWEYIAAFTVEFRVRGEKEKLEIAIRPVDITEGGDWGEVTGEEPTVVEGERLYQWMLEQVSEKMQREPEAYIVTCAEDEASVTGITVPKVKVSTRPMSQEEAKAAFEAIREAMMAGSAVAEEATPAPEAALPKAPIVIAEPAAAPSVAVEIAQVQAFQPPDVETPTAAGEANQPFSGFVRSGEPFRLEASFELAGPAVAEVAKKQVTYRAQFYARNRSTGERLHLGDTKPDTLIEGKSSYTATLPKAALQPGLYRLRVLATLQGVRTAPGYLEVPLLQVV
jgi:hypothetical protein